MDQELLKLQRAFPGSTFICLEGDWDDGDISSWLEGAKETVRREVEECESQPISTEDGSVTRRWKEELIQKTIRVWERASGKPVSRTHAIEMLENVRREFIWLENSLQG